LITHLLDDVHGFHTAFVGGLAVDDTDEELAGVAILRVESCLVLVLGKTAENDGDESMRAELAEAICWWCARPREQGGNTTIN